ncbi:MAG: hypothetical protein M1817_006602 [Caeruleum heppii]|nr:MAG: hypothetical protein M1817_006602 [Caeruleum heppii]
MSLSTFDELLARQLQSDYDAESGTIQRSAPFDAEADDESRATDFAVDPSSHESNTEDQLSFERLLNEPLAPSAGRSPSVSSSESGPPVAVSTRPRFSLERMEQHLVDVEPPQPAWEPLPVRGLQASRLVSSVSDRVGLDDFFSDPWAVPSDTFQPSTSALRTEPLPPHHAYNEYGQPERILRHCCRAPVEDNSLTRRRSNTYYDCMFRVLDRGIRRLPPHDPVAILRIIGTLPSAEEMIRFAYWIRGHQHDTECTWNSTWDVRLQRNRWRWVIRVVKDSTVYKFFLPDGMIGRPSPGAVTPEW